MINLKSYSNSYWINLKYPNKYKYKYLNWFKINIIREQLMRYFYIIVKLSIE